MELNLYQVDAFTSKLFAGNPAAVVPLDEWLDDHLLQAIAAENNLSETAFVGPGENGLRLRWFTPAAEVDLCGHATLATAFVLFNIAGADGDTVEFESRSGKLTVTRGENGRLEMDLPAWPAEAQTLTPGIAQTLGAVPEDVFLGPHDLMAVFEKADDIHALVPDTKRIMQLDTTGLIVTAPGTDCDFVSRYFAPRVGIPEDPVTGSAHCMMAPYWAEKLGRNPLHARQVSARGGELWCRVDGDRVHVSGSAVLYLEGRIRVPG